MNRLLRNNVRLARLRWTNLDGFAIRILRAITNEHSFSIACGDLIWLERGWYVTHTGLVRLAQRHRCAGIYTKLLSDICNSQTQSWAFETTVYKSKTCLGFNGFGDADPSNVSPFMRGAELRIAETRAVNRALRKAYGIGICSAEELGSSIGAGATPPRKSPSSMVAVNGSNENAANENGTRVRDRLCQLIRQHGLDPQLVKSYATAFCGTKTLREATREQVENFVRHLADWAEKDRNALLCELNSYTRSQQEGAA